MSLILLLLVILFFLVVFGIIRFITRNKQSNSMGNMAEEREIVSVNKSPNKKPSAKTCPLCFGTGYRTQPQQRAETKMETTTEFYTNHLGQRQSRTVTKPKTVWRTVQLRSLCTSCGGSGRRMY